MSINQSLTILFVEMYNKEKEKGITFIPNFIVAKMTLLSQYSLFVKEGSMKPIEDLAVEEKQKLTDECREVKDHNYTNETLTETARILHLIKTINSYS